MLTSSMQNADFILITRKFPLSPFATCAILFQHEFAKLWDIRIPGHTLELRGTDSLGETVQIDEELSIGGK